MKQAASELRESEMYSSGSGMPLKNVTGDDGVDKSTEISGPPHISSYVPLSVEADRPVVVFDVETTGLGSTAHIIQIAATGPSSLIFLSIRIAKKVNFCPGHFSNCFVCPQRWSA